MSIPTSQNMIPLVHKRLYKGGHLSAIWFVFRKNAITGSFHITGYGVDCIFELNRGVVIGFTVNDEATGIWKGDEALTRLRHLVQKGNVRFSVFVSA